MSAFDEPGPVGFIGLGEMGRPMVGHLLAAGLPVYICDPDPAAVAAAVAAGAIALARAVEVADAAETVMVCVPTPEIVEKVCVGPAGLVEGGRVRRIVDHSTTGPAMARVVSAALAERGIAYLDAPLAGSTPAAKAGTLTIMAAGDGEEFEAVRAILDVYGETVSLIGVEVGQGHLLKLINNMILCATLVASTEALAVGMRAGISADTMLATLNRGTARSFASQALLQDRVASGNPQIGFRLELMRKDLRLLLEQAAERGITMPVSASVKATFDRGQTALGLDADVLAIAPFIVAEAGAPFE
ncbi:NAD(P)-dependent oxidoreductase [Sphingomonas arantia]|uniref:NAD(P)-dependent oxidoreductase n=1 Tax=Sphingomonas arantia TaxID=1460676 RepID=A0ABW4U1D9_9SPHN